MVWELIARAVVAFPFALFLFVAFALVVDRVSARRQR